MVRQNQTAEDSSPLIKWLAADQWIDGTSADPALSRYSASSFRLSTTNGAYALFSFNGTGAWIYGAKRGNHGPYKCTVDGNDQPQQDGYSDPDQFGVPLCSAPNLKMDSHTITITNLQTDATRPYLDVDYIVWETEISDQATQPPAVIDDADTNSIQYAPPGEWSTSACQNVAAYLANSCHITGSNTATASLTFEGDAIAIYGGVGPQYGPYSVSLDGQDPASFTANSTNNHTQQTLYFASGLGAGNHTVVIKNDPATIGNQLDIDYFQVMGRGIPSGNNDGDGNGSKVGPIVGAVVGVVGLIAILGLAWFFWRRRKQSEQREKVDLGENDRNNFDGAMANALPTPYIVSGGGRNDSGAALHDQGNMSTHSVSMQTFGAAAASSPGHPPQQAPTTYNASTYQRVTSGSSSNGDGSGRGASNNNNGISLAGAVAPGSALGMEKGANLYTGPTGRNDAEQLVDAPPSYTR